MTIVRNSIRPRGLGVLLTLACAFVTIARADHDTAASTACADRIRGWRQFQHGDGVGQAQNMIQEVCPRNPTEAQYACMEEQLKTRYDGSINPLHYAYLCRRNPTPDAVACFNRLRNRHYLPQLGFADGIVGPDTALKLCSRNTSNEAESCLLELLRKRYYGEWAAHLCGRDPSSRARSCFQDQVSNHGVVPSAAARICSAPNLGSVLNCFAILKDQGVSQAAASSLCLRNSSPSARECLLSFKQSGINEFVAVEPCATGSFSSVSPFPGSHPHPGCSSQQTTPPPPAAGPQSEVDDGAPSGAATDT